MTPECYCTALRLAARKLTAVYDETLAPANISVAQYSLLRRIERAGTLSLTELGRRTGLDRSTIGRNVKVLERMGLIEDAPGHDGREACVALTPTGQMTLNAAEPLWKQAQQQIETAIGQDVAVQLRRTLQDL